MPRPGLVLGLVLALAGAVGCGPSRAEIRAARTSVYQTEFVVVWNAVSEIVREQYPRFAVEDPIHGQIITDWHLVERVDFDQDPSGGGQTVDPNAKSKPQTGSAGLPNIGGVFFRVTVDIRPGGPPWRVQVDGEAALYRPGMALITPYKHGAADEPSWVGPRLDKVRVGIYKALRGYARVPAEKARPQVARDDARWQNLPPAAIKVVSDVHAAAGQKDLAGVRRHMSDGFVWSVAGTPGVDGAVAFWNADPTVLAKLRDTLATGCDSRAEGTLVVCPVTADQPGTWRAEFARDDAGTWRFSAFYLNE